MNNSGSESPRPSRKRFGSASEETILKQVVNGDGGLSLANPLELDNLRADIIREMRIEINKAKQEILDGEYTIAIKKKIKGPVSTEEIFLPAYTGGIWPPSDN